MKPYYKGHRPFSNPIRCQNQQGWMLVEVLLCLTLLAVVLHLAQGQSEAQWQSLQLAEMNRKLEENTQKQTAMVTLTGSTSWSSDGSNRDNVTYPSCQDCTGSQLEAWFYASQHDVSSISEVAE